MGSERHTACKKRRDHAKGRRRIAQRGETQQRRGRGPNERVHGVPHGIEIRHFVGEEFDDVEGDCDSEHGRMREDLHRVRQVNHSEALQQAERRHRRVEVQTGSE